jgi:hypothetical protein
MVTRMTARGAHFALDDLTAAQLLAAAGDDEAVAALIGQIGAGGQFPRCDTGKAWESIHRSLTDGGLTFENGSFPYNAAILGGEQLYQGDDHIISYLTPPQAYEVAGALAGVTEPALRQGYQQIEAEDYLGELGDEDFRYTWSNLASLTIFFGQAAEAKLHVIFTVSE